MKDPVWPKFVKAEDRACAGHANWHRTPSDLRAHLIRCANRWPTCPKHGNDLEIVGTYNPTDTFLSCPHRWLPTTEEYTYEDM